MLDDYCDYCGNEPDECVCHLAPDFPMEADPILDTDYLDWGHYEENNDESSGQEDFSEADPDGYCV
jgi:hypothetical protein